MDFFEHRYYRLNKKFMRLFGQWPYQSTRVRCAIHIVILSFAVTHMIPQLIAFVKNINDWDLVMESAVPLLFVAFCTTKYLSFVVNSRKMLMLLRHIQADWEIWDQDQDIDVLHEYAEKGRMMVSVYAVVNYITCPLFIIQPTIPKIIDVILKNGTETGKFPIPVDYCCIDMQKYYFYIILHGYLYASLGFISAITYDCIFIVHVQHGCGLFAALGRKSEIQRIGNDEKRSQAGDIAGALDEPYVDLENLGWCIDRHRDAIKYANLVEATYSWCFFVIMGINMLLISMTGLQLVKGTIDRQETIRFIFSNISEMTHLYIDNYMAQILMDHSISIRYYIHNGEWYRLPIKIQKLLLLMIMRCNVPCRLTAGKFSIMCMETFGMILKTSLSYFTLLRSH